MDLFLLELDELRRDFDTVFLLELLLLCLSMGVGFYTVYTDLRFRDIPNIAAYGLLGAGLLGQAGFALLGKTTPAQIALVAGAGFGVSYLLYLYGFWAPGDAKLFWALLVAFPPTLCFDTGFFSLQAPLWALLINAILLSFLFLVIVVLLQRRRRPAPARAGIPWKQWLRAGLDLAGLTGLVVGGAGLALGRPLEFAEGVISAVVLYLLLNRFVAQEYRLALALPGLALGLYAALAPASWGVLLAVWAVAWAIQSVYRLLKRRFGDALVQAMAVEALQVGMIPAAAICVSQKAEREQGPYVCVAEVQGKRSSLCRVGAPLSQAEVDKLHDLGMRGLFQGFGDRLPVESPVPFAPFLLLSVIATAILAGNVSLVLLPYLRQWLG